MGKQAGSARPKEVRAGWGGGQVWAGSPSLTERRGPLSFHRRRRQSWRSGAIPEEASGPDSCCLVVSRSLPSFFLASGADAAGLLWAASSPVTSVPCALLGRASSPQRRLCNASVPVPEPVRAAVDRAGARTLHSGGSPFVLVLR